MVAIDTAFYRRSSHYGGIKLATQAQLRIRERSLLSSRWLQCGHERMTRRLRIQSTVIASLSAGPRSKGVSSQNDERITNTIPFQPLIANRHHSLHGRATRLHDRGEKGKSVRSRTAANSHRTASPCTTCTTNPSCSRFATTTRPSALQESRFEEPKAA